MKPDVNPGMQRGWQSRREAGSSTMLHFIRWFALTAGERSARWCLYPITAYFLIRRHAERRASRAYLRRVLGREPRLIDIARHFHTFAITILDRVFLLTGTFTRDRVRLHGLHELSAYLEQGTGITLLGAHFGSFEAVRVIGLERRDVRLRILMDYQQNARLSKTLDALNAHASSSIIDAGDEATRVLLAIHETLAAGGLVGMLADRVRPGEPANVCQLLGANVSLPTGPFRIAAVVRKPVMLIFSILRSDHTYDVYFEAFADARQLGGRGKRDQVIREWMVRYAQRLESRMHEAPYNWFNFYDFWATAPTETHSSEARELGPASAQPHA